MLKHTDQKIAIRTASDRDGVLCHHVLLAEALSNGPPPMPSVSPLHRSQVSHTDAAPDVLMTIGPVAQDSTFVSQGVPGSSSALITYSGDAFMSSSGLRQACAFNLGGLIEGRNDRLEFLCEVARSFVPRCRPSSLLDIHIRTRHALGCRIRVPSLSQCVRANLYA